MLTSLVLQVRVEQAVRLPAGLGRASQALLLRLIQAQDAALSARLHDEEGLRPYTASNLVLGRRADGCLLAAPGESGWLRFTGLTEEVSACLRRLADDPPAMVDMDGCPLRVVGATMDAAQHPWAAQSDYPTLAARHLLAGENPPPRLTLEFVSPTTFRSSGRYVPMPLPELVFGSLSERWQAFAPVALSPEVRRFAAEMVVVSRYLLRTRSLPGKEGGLHIGFIGQVTFRTLNRDRYWLSVLNLLAEYAFFSGVGYGTAAGLGQVRSVPTPPRDA
ncbi:MAG: CRISPR system precrRNA processing endoribonuclease RAMP protein Cas6 [Anaerolineae bacterium]|nr:CRISPR system precrRNA processing endoribonuclease RAMP protein Cas6 [Anaerolineae bacterium]MDW8070878.1 CRISPR system precrRNA processing endoribonuclease RAMP protein Cas6 [Anaerolineae bacterium]